MNIFQVAPKPYLVFAVFVLTQLYIRVICAESDYQWQARSRHNRYRAMHNARSLYSSNDLNRKAVKCAQYYINRGAIDHTCPHARKLGENIWANFGGDLSSEQVISRSVDGWYKEEPLYNYRGSQRGTGHFTQMVWKRTEELGFGIDRSQKRKMTVAVALYYPPGNYLGEFSKNVEPPRSRPQRRRH